MDESAFLLNQLFHARHNATAAALSARGANVGSPRLLVTLAHYPGGPDQAPTQKELAGLLHSAPATIAASLKVLERQGYVARHTDEKDSRRNRVAITQRGRDVLEAGMQVFRQVDDAMFQGFTPSEREQVRRFHKRMLDNLYQIGGGQEAGDCPPPPPVSDERKCNPCSDASRLT